MDHVRYVVEESAPVRALRAQESGFPLVALFTYCGGGLRPFLQRYLAMASVPFATVDLAAVTITGGAVDELANVKLLRSLHGAEVVLVEAPTHRDWSEAEKVWLRDLCKSKTWGSHKFNPNLRVVVSELDTQGASRLSVAEVLQNSRISFLNTQVRSGEVPLQELLELSRAQARLKLVA